MKKVLIQKDCIGWLNKLFVFSVRQAGSDAYIHVGRLDSTNEVTEYGRGHEAELL